MILGKSKGIHYSASEFLRNKAPHLIGAHKYFENILKHFTSKRKIHIEVNLVKHGTLADELLLDYRLKKELIKSDMQKLNKMRGIAFYDLGINDNFLLSNFHKSKFCYITVDKIEPISFLRIALHEMFHFQDPIDIEEYRDLNNYVDFKSLIKAKTRMGLNEYAANLGAFSWTKQIIDILNEEFEENREKNYCLLLYRLQSYIHGIHKKLFRELENLLNRDISDASFQGSMIFFIFDEFFNSIMYFLGGWRALKRDGFNDVLIKLFWDFLILKIKQKFGRKLKIFLGKMDYRKFFRIINILQLSVNGGIEDIVKSIREYLEDFLTMLKVMLVDHPKYPIRLIFRYYECEFIQFFYNPKLMTIFYLAKEGYF